MLALHDRQHRLDPSSTHVTVQRPRFVPHLLPIDTPPTQGVHSLGASLPEPRDVRPSATAVAGGDDGWLLALGARATGSGGSLSGQGGPDGVGGALFSSALDPEMLNPPALVNVNNRLVPETTVLNDGDLVILAREKVKI